MTPDQWSRVKDLFHAALDLEPGRREAFLTTACGDDAALRNEIQRLLAAHSAVGTFIDASPVPPVEALSAADASFTGRTIGHYQVGRLIGVGGMGAVYVAHDVDLGRTVALKVVATDALDAQAQLRREAQQASQLNHPNICTIHEVGSADGHTYFAMEYVEGPTIAELLATTPPPLDTALRHGIQIADAVSHAHHHGLIHRDLKSANIMVTRDGRAKVLDFGLSQRVPPDRLTGVTQSKTSIEGQPLAGTLAYMAPELLRGGTADARTDIWALGVVLYEMATGGRPFSGRTGFELSASILDDPPAPVPDRIPLPLRGVIAGCLAKDRHERYTTAAEVRSALEAVRAAASGATSPAPSPRMRHLPARAMTLGAALVFAVMLAVGWLWTRQSPEPVGVGTSGRPAIAVMSFDNLAGPETAWMTTGVPTMLLTGLAQTRGLDIVSSQSLLDAVRQLGFERLESLGQTQIADVARRAGAGAVVLGSIARSGNQFRIDARLEDLASGRVLAAQMVSGTDVFALVDQLGVGIRAGIGFMDATDIRRVIEVSTESIEAYRLYSLALDASNTVRWEEATTFLREAVRIDSGFAEAYLQLAMINRLNGRDVSWRENLRKASEHSKRLNERQRLFLSVETARADGNPPEAARVLDELVTRFPDSDDAYYVVFQLYGPFGGIHDPEKALKIIRAAVAARPSAAVFRNLYGYGFLGADRYLEAIREFETYARLAPREPNPYDSLGEAYLHLGDPLKAIEFYSRALTVDPRFRPASNGRTWGLAMLGRYDEAIAENPPDPTLRAFVLSRAGRYADAIKTLDAALLDPIAKESEPTRAGISLLLAVFALERQQYTRARQGLRDAEAVYARMNAQDRRPYLVLIDSLAGTLDLAQQRPEAAASRLSTLHGRYNPSFVTERWWAKALEGDLALATGRLQEAADAYAAGEPAARMWLSALMPAMSIVSNHLPSRDGPARVARARGDLPGAVQAYRRLISADGQQKWNAMLEPRYVLEIARLLERTGDAQDAATEYRRFLDFWKNADPDLPELAEARRAVARMSQ